MTRPAWLLFISLSIVWGLPYFFIKIALVDLPPAWIAFGRVALGALILVWFVPRADWKALRPRAAAIAAVGLTDIALPLYLIANGERGVSSSLTGIVLSALPITVCVLALAVGAGERLPTGQIVGLGIGVAGVVVLLGFTVVPNQAQIGGLAIIAGALLSYGAGVLMIKSWLADVPLLASTAAMLGAAAMLLAPPALAAVPLHAPAIETLAAVGILGTVCTAAAYVMSFELIARAGAVRATVVTYLNPAIAAVLGVVVLHESIGVATVAGLLLVIAGSWLSAGGPPAAKRTRGRQAIPAVAADHSGRTAGTCSL